MMGDEAPVIATSCMNMLEALAPLRELAKGYRTQLEADGWSPTAAERIAGDLLIEATRKGVRS